jgi:hypothetical protein
VEEEVLSDDHTGGVDSTRQRLVRVQEDIRPERGNGGGYRRPLRSDSSEARVDTWHAKELETVDVELDSGSHECHDGSAPRRRQLSEHAFQVRTCGVPAGP